jgi:AraC-like DNA-binding protein
MSCSSACQEARVCIRPSDLVERQCTQWQGLRADVVALDERAPFEYRYKAPYHLLIATEQAERDDGETSVEGLPPSALRSMSGTLTFVPAGHEFRGWQRPRAETHVNYFYLDPRSPLLADELRLSEIEFQPRLFFQDPVLWQLAAKLKNESTKGGGRLAHYGEALGVMLGHELVRLNGAPTPPLTVMRGGLSGWQRKKVADFIEEHLAEDVRLSALADLVDLSPYHFARAFKRSFGVPPHRYHVGRRIERAKALLTEQGRSVTEVALTLGFAETSSFSATFRRSTGTSPTAFRRSLA